MSSAGSEPAIPSVEQSSELAPSARQSARSCPAYCSQLFTPYGDSMFSLNLLHTRLSQQTTQHISWQHKSNYVPYKRLSRCIINITDPLLQLPVLASHSAAKAARRRWPVRLHHKFHTTGFRDHNSQQLQVLLPRHAATARHTYVIAARHTYVIAARHTYVNAAKVRAAQDVQAACLTLYRNVWQLTFQSFVC